MRALLWLSCWWVAAASASDYSFTGYARDPASGELLYVESHAVRAGGTAGEERVVLYRPSERAQPFARKTLAYGSDRVRPSFEFVDQRSGFAESVAREARDIVISARPGAQAATRTARLAEASVAVIDAGFDEFVRAHWTRLQRGESLTTPFLVPSQLGAVSFRLRKTGEARIGDDEASVIRLSLAGPLGWFLSDIDISYRNRDARLLRYRGLTNIRDARGELITAQIDFPDEARVNGSVDLGALRALPLSASR
jgi:hypothetical protein